MTNNPEDLPTKLCIYGAGLLGRQIVHCIKHYTDYDLIGFIDDTRKTGSNVLDQYSCLGGLNEVVSRTELSPDNITVCFAIGYANMQARMNAYQQVKMAGYRLTKILHPNCFIEPDVTVGEGSIVLSGAILDQNVIVGEASYIDIGVRIGENSRLGNNNYVSAGVGVGGSVLMGDSNFIGMDSTVTTDVTIGSNCFINAKSLVSSNLPDKTKYVELHKFKKLPN